ncbi:hypothetical protein SAMN05216467_2836 [Cellulomonas sp. KH9]|nr:hypothetical protein SAMN05216467_2836 [Cellulomonas sp. KH9]
MAGRRGLFVRKDASAGTSPQDARLALAGLVAPAGDLGVTPGVLSGCAVSGTSGWTYTVSAGHVVLTRGASDGAVLASIDGTTPTPAVAAAPASGSRWDLIWVRQRDVDSGDADSQVQVGVTSGSSSGSPSRPTGSVPAGALVLAEARVSAGATQTSHASVTITPVAARSAARGGIVPAANAASREAVAAAHTPTPSSPLYVHQVDTRTLWMYDGATQGSRVAAPIAEPRVATIGATGVGPVDTKNAEVTDFVIPPGPNHLVKMTWTAFMYNGGNTGAVNIKFRVDGTFVGTMNYSYGGNHGDRRVIDGLTKVVSVAPGAHSLSVWSGAGAASVGYDGQFINELSVTDLGPVTS